MRKLDFEKPPARVLLIKPSAIGDIVHALPVLALLRRRWPHAKIDWLVSTSCASLLEGHRMIDELLHWDRVRFGGQWWKPTVGWEMTEFGRELKRRQYDLVVDLQGLFRSGLMAWKTAAPIRVGFRQVREFGWAFYTHRVEMDWNDHAVDRYLNIAEALGCGRGPVEFPFATTAADRQYVRDLLGDIGPYAVLLPGTNWFTKRWPVENYAALAEIMPARFGLRAVAAGGPDDIGLAARIPAATDLAGKTTLRQTVALLEQAAIVIANDSGPMHIASALGRPLVAMFGPTNPVRTGPYGRMDTVLQVPAACSPCYSRSREHCSCLKWLEIRPVIDAIEKQLHTARVNSAP